MLTLMSDLPIRKLFQQSFIVWGVVMLFIWLRKIFLLYFSTEILVGLVASIGIALFEFYSNKNEASKQKNISEIESMKEQINEISDKLDYNLMSLENMSSNFNEYDLALDKLKADMCNEHISELKEMNNKLFLLLDNKNEQFD